MRQDQKIRSALAEDPTIKALTETYMNFRNPEIIRLIKFYQQQLINSFNKSLHWSNKAP